MENKTVDKMVEAFRKSKNGIVPMESSSGGKSDWVAVTVDGVGYRLNIERAEAYDIKDEKILKRKVNTHNYMCDICHKEDAVYDSKTTFGPWGNLCEGCFDKYGIKSKGMYSKLK